MVIWKIQCVVIRVCEKMMFFWSHFKGDIKCFWDCWGGRFDWLPHCAVRIDWLSSHFRSILSEKKFKKLKWILFKMFTSLEINYKSRDRNLSPQKEHKKFIRKKSGPSAKSNIKTKIFWKHHQIHKIKGNYIFLFTIKKEIQTHTIWMGTRIKLHAMKIYESSEHPSKIDFDEKSTVIMNYIFSKWQDFHSIMCYCGTMSLYREDKSLSRAIYKPINLFSLFSVVKVNLLYALELREGHLGKRNSCTSVFASFSLSKSEWNQEYLKKKKLPGIFITRFHLFFNYFLCESCLMIERIF